MKNVRINKKSIIVLLKDLIKIESINPNFYDGSGEVEISRFIADYLESKGMVVHVQDVTNGRQNVIGVLRGSGSGDGRNLMLSGHTDTVGVEGMTIDPFNPVIKADDVYGRGACDMKGSLAAMIEALEAIKNSKYALKGDLSIAAVIDEEWASLGTEKLIQEYNPDAVIVGEPTGGQIVTAHKGFVCVEITTYGKAVHGSIPDKGINAVENMARLVCALDRLKESYSRRKHELLGKPTIYCSLIEGGADCSIVPDYCRLLMEKRVIPGENESSTIQEINNTINQLSIEDPSFKANAHQRYERQPMEISSNEPIVSCLMCALKGTSNKSPQIVGSPGWTDASLFVNEAHIPACIFGPGDIDVAHSACEFINLGDVVNSARTYALTALEFCGCLSQ